MHFRHKEETVTKKVPQMVKKARGRDVSSEEIGPPNAEPKGVWQVLRNGLLLIVCIFAVLFVNYSAL